MHGGETWYRPMHNMGNSTLQLVPIKQPCFSLECSIYSLTHEHNSQITTSQLGVAGYLSCLPWCGLAIGVRSHCRCAERNREGAGARWRVIHVSCRSCSVPPRSRDETSSPRHARAHHKSGGQVRMCAYIRVCCS